MKIIPLGTSSGKPSLSRNVSSLAITGEGEWWLFDCGEGAQMQIAKAGLSFHRLAGIFITHLHGDHFNGLPGLLATMGLDRRDRELVLIGPPGISEYLETLGRLKILFLNYPLKLRELAAGSFRLTQSGLAEAEVVYEDDRYLVSARPLDHRIFAIGYRIEEKEKPGRFNLERARELGIPEGPLYGQLQSGCEVRLADGRTIKPSEVLGPPRRGKAVAYCLDTRPCATAVELARNVDWLIFEATYTRDLSEEARAYGHSTAEQAAQIATEAAAQRLLITHISPRYADARPLLAEAREVFKSTTLAADLLEIEV